MAELDEFLRRAKQAGATDEFLVSLLKQQGWPEKTVYQALGRMYEESTGHVLPQPPSTLESAREAFYHLLAFATLGAWVFAIGSIWFELIDTWLPDPMISSYRSWSLRNVSFQIAAILVSFPVFVAATRSILRDMAQSPEKAASGVRRWLTNLALLLTVLIMTGDLIGLLTALLQGELSWRFVSKSAVVLVLAGGVFSYYTRGLARREALPAQSWHRNFAGVAGLLILLSLGLGFWKTGSPATQRVLAQDARRLQDLNRLQQRVNASYQSATPRELPQSLNTGNDPFTAQPYEYIRGEGRQFELCSNFDVPTPEPLDAEQDFWRHPAGRHCFAFTAGEYVSPPPYR